MASSSNRKLNSSGSKAPKPTFRRAGAGAPRPAQRSQVPPRPSSVPAPAKAISAYTAPSREHTARRAAAVVREQRLRKAQGAPSAPRPTKRPANSLPARSRENGAMRRPASLPSGPSRALPARAGGSAIQHVPAPARQVRPAYAPATRGARPQRASASRPVQPLRTADAHRPPTPAAGPARRRGPMEAKRLTHVAAAPRGSEQASARPRRSAGLSRAHIALVAVAGVLALVALAVVVVVNSSLFAATDIRIVGSEHVAQDAAEQLINLPEGTTLLNVDEDQIVESLKQNPWVAGVDVKREYPHTLVITPRERAVSAIMYVAADDIAWAIGNDGCWIAPLSLAVAVDDSGAIVESGIVSTAISDQAEDGGASAPTDTRADPSADGADASEDGAADASDAGDGSASDDGGSDAPADEDKPAEDDGDGEPADQQDLAGLGAAEALARHFGALLLTDVASDVAPSSGSDVSAPIILAGLDYAKKFSSDFKAQIKYLSVPSKEAIAANLVSGIEVALGAPEDIGLKERVVTTLLEQQPGVTYIDVRTPNAYTFRSVPK